MKIKQHLIKSCVQLLKKLIGQNNTLLITKHILHTLPIRYAFPLTWLCLDELPLNAQTEAQYRLGVPRNFPQTKVKVNPKCLHARFFAISGYYEEFLTKEILSPKRKGLLIDIGANFGYYSILWLQKNETRAIAIEPVEEYVQLLNENLQSYAPRYSIFPGCIGDRDGAAFVDTFGDPTMLSKVVTEDRTESRRVEMLTLSSLLKQCNEQTIDVLKIDAEGYDIKILEGCQPLFETKSIKTVFWEPANSPEEQKMINFLENLGYSKILDRGAIGYELLSN